MKSVLFALLLVAPSVYSQDVTFSEEVVKPEPVVVEAQKPQWEWQLVPFMGMRVPGVCLGDQCAVMPKVQFDVWIEWAMKLREA